MRTASSFWMLQCRLVLVILAFSVTLVCIEVLIYTNYYFTNVVQSSAFLIDESFHHSKRNTPPKNARLRPTNTTTTTAKDQVLGKISVKVQKARALVPDWIDEYRQWHQKQRESLKQDNWQQNKYLILKCLVSDSKCAGTADRFKLLPVLLLLAHQSQRILLIHWERPAALETFLLPPQDGLDWRLPLWLKEKVNLSDIPERHMTATGDDVIHRPDEQTIALRRLNNPLHKEYYEMHRKPNEPRFEDVFRHIWSLLFEPSPPIAALIQQETQRLDLEPGQYAAAHVRSLFSRERLAPKRQFITAIHCAAQQFPDAPIFFASDSLKMTSKALQYGGHGYTVVARTKNQNPIHLDRGRHFLDNSNDWQRHSPSDYYDTFVDLYLLANSRCVSYGLGGFGLLGAMLSYNVTCSHWYNKGPPCRGNRKL